MAVAGKSNNWQLKSPHINAAHTSGARYWRSYVSTIQSGHILRYFIWFKLEKSSIVSSVDLRCNQLQDHEACIKVNNLFTILIYANNNSKISFFVLFLQPFSTYISNSIDIKDSLRFLNVFWNSTWLLLSKARFVASI